MCFTQCSHCDQSEMIPFRFALVHQRSRDRTDEAHVDSEAEAKVLTIYVVSIERRRLAQASRSLSSSASRGSVIVEVLFDQLCIQRIRH